MAHSVKPMRIVPPTREASREMPSASTNGPRGDFERPEKTEYPVAGPAQVAWRARALELMREALGKARTARMHILDEMEKAITEPRTELSPYAPRIITIKIPVDKIRDVIGAGGKVIRQITAETGTEINVEDDGTIQIAATSGEAAQKAIKWIEGLTKDVEVGKEYLGKVTRIMNFGAFVEILPGKEGLVHISQLADYRVPRVEDVVSIGDELMDSRDRIEKYIRLAREVLPGVWTRPFGEGPGYAFGSSAVSVFLYLQGIRIEAAGP